MARESWDWFINDTADVNRKIIAICIIAALAVAALLVVTKVIIPGKNYNAAM